MEFAPCRHLTQPWHCNSPKKSNTTRLKCCACHAKWRWTRPKCCACHENCNASSENVAKVLRLPHKTNLDTLYKTRLNVTKCHACHAKRSNATCETSNNDPSAELTIGTPYGHHANGCGRWRTVADGSAMSSEHTPRPQSETGTLATHSGKITVRIFQINIVYSDRESSPWPYSRTFWYHGLLGNKMLQECSVFLKEPIPLEYVVFPKSHDHDCKCHTSRSNVCYLHCRIFYVQKTSKNHMQIEYGGFERSTGELKDLYKPTYFNMFYVLAC